MRFKLAAVAAAIAFLTALGWLYFPGHTYLHSDTQIYLPILERLRDPSVYPSDPVALHPHVSYTVYDEAARFLRWATGFEFSTVLFFQQVVWRFCGLAGAFLIALAARLSTPISLLVASICGLGAAIGGPAVLIVEYEPVPRGFAVPLVVLAIGLAAHSKWLWAGAACGVAMLYHPPTTLPFCAVFGLLAAWQWRTGKSAGAIKGLLPAVIAAAIVLAMSRLQAGAIEQQDFFGHIGLDLEKLQRLRGSYNWISMWGAHWIRQHEFFGLVCLAAWLRLRNEVTPPLRWMMAGLPLYALLTIPVSYVLLEQSKWLLMTQLQPARAVLFLSLFALLGSAIAGTVAARAGRIWEALPWWLLAFAIPAQADVLQLLLPDLRDPALRTRWLIVLALAAAATLAAYWQAKRPRRAAAVLAAAVIAPFWALPGPAQVRNYPNLDEPELHQLGDWARNNTSKQAVFLFPQHGRDLTPGFFRVYSLRNVYVDWKGGGQVNLLKQFAVEWWDRWQKALEVPFDPAHPQRYRALGVDYLVLKAGTLAAGCRNVYENRRYSVCALGD